VLIICHNVFKSDTEDIFIEIGVLSRYFYWKSEFQVMLYGEKVPSVMLD
jgi:hypothetical protein